MIWKAEIQRLPNNWHRLIRYKQPHGGKRTMAALDATNNPLQVETTYKRMRETLNSVESSNA